MALDISILRFLPDLVSISTRLWRIELDLDGRGGEGRCGITGKGGGMSPNAIKTSSHQDIYHGMNT